MSARRFAFLHDPRVAPLLRPLGATPSTCWVEVDDEALRVRFGRFGTDTPLTNVADACVTGPYRWYRAVGVRLSLADRGATLGTTALAGTCILFHEPVALLLGSWRPHTGLTVTVADPGGLAEELRGRASDASTVPARGP